jgi:hypothetical protein
MYKVIRISKDNYEKLLLYQAVLQFMSKRKVSLDSALSDILSSVTFKNLDQKTLSNIIASNPKIINKLVNYDEKADRDSWG